MGPWRVGLHASLAGVVAVVLASCGSRPAGVSADQTVTAARRATSGLHTFEVKGTLPLGGTTVGFDMSEVSHKGASGTLALDGTTIGVTRIGDDLYVDATAAFYQGLAMQSPATLEAATIGGDRWIRTTVGDPALARWVPLTEASFFLGLLASDVRWTMVGPTNVYGASVLEVSSPGGGSVYVSNHGLPYLVEAAGRTAVGEGQVDLVSFDQPYRLEAPAGALDLASVAAPGPGG